MYEIYTGWHDSEADDTYICLLVCQSLALKTRIIIDYLQNNTETRYCMNNIYTHNTLDLDWNIYMLCCQTFLLIDDSVLYEKKINYVWFATFFFTALTVKLNNDLKHYWD